jgi:hypothetical protein
MTRLFKTRDGDLYWLWQPEGVAWEVALEHWAWHGPFANNDEALADRTAVVRALEWYPALERLQ